MTTDQEVRERVRSYVGHQAAKEPAAIRQLVQRAHDQLLGLIDGLSDDQASYKPGPDEWCILDVLRHVEESKRGIAAIAAALAQSETPGQTPTELGRIGTIESAPFSSLAEARSALDASHGELLAFIDTIASQTNLEASSPHPWFGEHNCKEWAVFQCLHDRDHAGQIEQIKSAPGFPAA